MVGFGFLLILGGFLIKSDGQGGHGHLQIRNGLIGKELVIMIIIMIRRSIHIYIYIYVCIYIYIYMLCIIIITGSVRFASAPVIWSSNGSCLKVAQCIFSQPSLQPAQYIPRIHYIRQYVPATRTLQALHLDSKHTKQATNQDNEQLTNKDIQHHNTLTIKPAKHINNEHNYNEHKTILLMLLLSIIIITQQLLLLLLIIIIIIKQTQL